MWATEMDHKSVARFVSLILETFVHMSAKAQIELIIGLDNTDLLPVEEWKNYKKPQNLSFRKSKVVKNP